MLIHHFSVSEKLVLGERFERAKSRLSQREERPLLMLEQLRGNQVTASIKASPEIRSRQARQLRFTRRGELLDSAFRPIVRAIGLLRTDRVVVSCPRLEVVQAHAENYRGVVRVQPGRRFRSLDRVLGIDTIVHDTVMLWRGSGLLVVHLIIVRKF